MVFTAEEHCGADIAFNSRYPGGYEQVLYWLCNFGWERSYGQPRCDGNGPRSQLFEMVPHKRCRYWLLVYETKNTLQVIRFSGNFVEDEYVRFLDVRCRHTYISSCNFLNLRTTIEISLELRTFFENTMLILAFID